MPPVIAIRCARLAGIGFALMIAGFPTLAGAQRAACGSPVEARAFWRIRTVVPHANAAQGYVAWEESLKYLAKHPGPVGAVIDENTALVLNGSSAEVIGTGNVALVDPARDKAKPFLILKVGAARDVAR